MLCARGVHGVAGSNLVVDMMDSKASCSCRHFAVCMLMVFADDVMTAHLGKSLKQILLLVLTDANAGVSNAEVDGII